MINIRPFQYVPIFCIFTAIILFIASLLYYFWPSIQEFRHLVRKMLEGAILVVPC